MKESKQPRIFLTLSVAFLAVILLPGILLFVLPARDFSDNENRKLASKPEFSFSALMDGTWQEGFEAYLSDQFVGRDFLCRVCSTAKIASGARDLSGAYLCSDGYLCEKVTDRDVDRDRYTDNLTKLAAYAKAGTDAGRTVSVMFVPSAAAIQSDRLPAFAPTYDSDAMFDEASAALSDVCRFVDLREPFAARESEGLYYRTDHHWTYRGAYLAYQNLCGALDLSPAAFEHDAVASGFYGTLWSKTLNVGQTPDIVVAPTLRSDITADNKIGGIYDASAVTKKDKYTYFLGGNEGIVTVTNPDAAGGKLLLIKDSFANSLLPYLTAHYSEIDVVDLRYFNGRLSRLTEEKQFDAVVVLYSMTSFSESKDLGKLKL